MKDEEIYTREERANDRADSRVPQSEENEKKKKKSVNTSSPSTSIMYEIKRQGNFSDNWSSSSSWVFPHSLMINDRYSARTALSDTDVDKFYCRVECLIKHMMIITSGSNSSRRVRSTEFPIFSPLLDWSIACRCVSLRKRVNEARLYIAACAVASYLSSDEDFSDNSINGSTNISQIFSVKSVSTYGGEKTICLLVRNWIFDISSRCWSMKISPRFPRRRLSSSVNRVTHISSIGIPLANSLRMSLPCSLPSSLNNVTSISILHVYCSCGRPTVTMET